MTHEQANELIIIARGMLGALGGIQEAIEKLTVATEKKPPSSKRGSR